MSTKHAAGWKGRKASSQQFYNQEKIYKPDFTEFIKKMAYFTQP